MPNRINYLLLDKDDITKICGIISRQQAMKELGYNDHQFKHFVDYSKIFKKKYILVEEKFSKCEKREA
ncbi:hypothetical protein [Candidatus Stoquefichus sp. SB1]|uniref:Uncharacterized protein n=1 Tax=Siphoviridae sp. ctQtc11 TaxID=2825497 RepID=A0A8S5P3A1_9CAUD|nr:hypothetical protein [Candidatus Stoquefichus sp. SB1]DAE01466.1 MAG TPA: hypothetical protein [Siphoviridae sp. ctQtc11]